MFFEEIKVETPSDAFDHLGQLHCALEGMSEITIDMSNSPIIPNKSIDFLSYMLTYCANILRASEDCLFEFYKAHRRRD